MYKCWNDFNMPNKIIGYIRDKQLKNPSLVCHYLYDTSVYNSPKCKECCFLFVMVAANGLGTKMFSRGKCLILALSLTINTF